MFSIDIQKYRPVGEITDPKEMVRSNSPETLPLGMTWQGSTGAIGRDEIYRADKKEINLTTDGKQRYLYLGPAGRGQIGADLYIYRKQLSAGYDGGGAK